MISLDTTFGVDENSQNECQFAVFSRVWCDLLRSWTVGFEDMSRWY